MEKDWYGIALEHFDEENYSQALFAITKFTTENPHDKAGLLVKALIYRDLSNFTAAFQLFDTISPTDSDDESYKKSFYGGLGETYKEAGNIKEALVCFDQYIALTPTETTGHILKGSCLFGAGEYELAREEFLKATTLEGDPEEAFYNLALLARAEMNFNEAKAHCERSLEIFPADERVINCLNDIVKTIKLIDEYGLKTED